MIANWITTSMQIEGETIVMSEKRLSVASQALCDEFGLNVIRESLNWFLLGDGNRRLLVSAVDEVES